MSVRELRARLSSSDRDVVLGALFELGAEKEIDPTDETLRLACKHLNHADPDVRGQAVFTVGIHWAFGPCFPELLRLISVEQDEEVAESLILALGRMGSASPAQRDASLHALARVSLAPDRSGRQRSLAFIQARWVAGMISARELGAELVEPENVKIDTAWVSEIAKGSSGGA